MSITTMQTACVDHTFRKRFRDVWIVSAKVRQLSRSHSSIPLNHKSPASTRALGGFDILLDTELQPSRRSFSTVSGLRPRRHLGEFRCLPLPAQGFRASGSGCWCKVVGPGTEVDVKVRNASLRGAGVLGREGGLSAVRLKGGRSCWRVGVA